MAEALGIASGIAGLVSLTVEVYGISYKYISGVHDASSSARRFLKELKDLQRVLGHVQRTAKGINEEVIFSNASSCLLSIEKSNEYVKLLEKVRNKLKQQETSSSLRNIVKALTWPFSEKETLDLTQSLHRHLEIYNTALTVDNLTIGKHTLSKVRQITDSQAASRMNEVLNWLSPLNMHQRQHDTLSRRQGITSSWLLTNSVFQDWLGDECSQQTLWCPGNPGTGKTVVTSVVIDYLLNNHKDAKIAYVYCDYKDQAAQTASNLVACLVRQIIGQPKVLPQQLAALGEDLEIQNRRPSLNDLKRLLLALCSQYTRIFIVVDALDECEAAHERRLLLPILESLPDARTRLFVTSRPNNEDISQTFRKASRITIAAPESDLRRYITERIEERKDFASKLTPDLKESITSTIPARASGMFLVAALQIDRIFATRTIKGIKSALTSMPRELDELYRQTLERIQKQASDDGLLGMRILSWITHAKRPLSVDELRHGLAVEYNNDEGEEELSNEFDKENLLSAGDLVDVCAGLVVIDSTSEVIRLVHYTTQEYFDKTRLHLFKNAEVDISRACLAYLSYDSVMDLGNQGSMRTALRFHPFLDYALHYWFSHVKSVLLAETLDTVFVKVVSRFKSSDRLPNATAILLKGSPVGNSWMEDRDRESTTFHLEAASSMGLEELVTVLLDLSTGPCPGLDSSLALASSAGDLVVVKLLVQNGAPIDSVSEDPLDSDMTNSVLELACYWGRSSVAKFLIENGVDIQATSSSSRPPLHSAAQPGWLKVVELLLDRGADASAKNNKGDTALHFAAKFGRLKVVKRLLDIGADASVKNNKGETARILLERLLSEHNYPLERQERMKLGVKRLLQQEQQSPAPATEDVQGNDRSSSKQEDIVPASPPGDSYLDPSTSRPEYQTRDLAT